MKKTTLTFSVQYEYEVDYGRGVKSSGPVAEKLVSEGLPPGISVIDVDGIWRARLVAAELTGVKSCPEIVVPKVKIVPVKPPDLEPIA